MKRNVLFSYAHCMINLAVSQHLQQNQSYCHLHLDKVDAFYRSCLLCTVYYITYTN